MKYDELVNALRCVGFSKQCDTCKYSKGYDDNENPNGCDWVQLERDAAAAIEEMQAEVESSEQNCQQQLIAMARHNAELQAEVKRLELDNEDYEHENRRLNGENEALRKNADEYLRDELEELKELLNDADVAADDNGRQVEELQAEVKRLEPKRWEWVRKDAELYYWHECSKCGERPLYDRYANKVLSAYCPNCGAKMEA